jgi:hypothetical protein
VVARVLGFESLFSEYKQSISFWLITIW